MAAPCLSALLWLDTFPDPKVIGLGLGTAFAGYTAVYALNDVIDYRGDQQKIQEGGFQRSGPDLDALYVRHPIAQGLLSYREGILWMLGWALLAFLGSYLLNPVCTLIFLIACFLEALYCSLLRATYLRGIISGVVKNSGGIAAVFAVDPHPQFFFLLVLFLWFFFWEIGGQNIPNDWADRQEDQRLGAQTIPVRFGPGKSRIIIYVALALVWILSLIMVWISPIGLGPIYIIGALFSGVYFLILPAHRLYKKISPLAATLLFNRASYYPLAMLLITLASKAANLE